MRPSTTVPWVWTRKEKQQTGAAADVDLWDPAAGKSVYLHKIIVSTSADATVQITEGDDAAGTRIVDVYLTTDTPLVISFPHEAPYKLAADAKVELTTSTGNSKVTLWGFEA